MFKLFLYLFTCKYNRVNYTQIPCSIGVLERITLSILKLSLSPHVPLVELVNHLEGWIMYS